MMVKQTTVEIIDKLENMCSFVGFSANIVVDNGLLFTSLEFKQWNNFD